MKLEVAAACSDFLADMVLDVMKAFFKIRSGQPPKNMEAVFIEALMNTLEHGNQKDSTKKIAVGVWLGERGVLFGFRDLSGFPFPAREMVMGVGLLRTAYLHKSKRTSQASPDKLAVVVGFLQGLSVSDSRALKVWGYYFKKAMAFLASIRMKA